MVPPLFIVECERIRNTQNYLLRFPINDQITQRIKNLPEETRKWRAKLLRWEVTAASLYLLMKKYKGSKKIYFDFGSEDSRKIFVSQIDKWKAKEKEKRKFIADLNIKKERWVKYKQELEENYEQYEDMVHKYLKPGIKLYPHQTVSVMFLNAVRNVLLALDMGTGKSLISIAYVEMNDFKKVFVITPASLKFNYYAEVKKFTNSQAYIIKWNKNDCLLEDAKYVIVNYDYFNSSDFKKTKNKFENLNIDKIDCLIADESHRLKSSKSNTYKAIKKIFNKKIFKNGVSKVFMSGTPMPSKSPELYTVLHEISPPLGSTVINK